MTENSVLVHSIRLMEFSGSPGLSRDNRHWVIDWSAAEVADYGEISQELSDAENLFLFAGCHEWWLQTDRSAVGKHRSSEMASLTCGWVRWGGE